MFYTHITSVIECTYIDIHLSFPLATGSTENPLLSEPQSQLQPQMHSKTQSGASLTLDSQQQGYRLGYGTPSTSSTPPFYQQSRPTTTPAGTTPLPEKTEMTATATETSTTVAKPPPASVSRLSTAAKQPQSSSLPLQSKSESSLFPHTGTSVRNTMPPTSSTQPPEFQQNSFLQVPMSPLRHLSLRHPR